MTRPPILAWAPRQADPLRLEVQDLGPRHPGVTVGLHGHRFYEFVLIERGGGTHRVGPRELPARSGDLFLIAPGQVHDLSGLDRARGTMVLFGIDAVEPRAAEASPVLPGELVLLAFMSQEATHLEIPRAQRARWQARITELREELGRERLGSRDAARSLLRLLLIDAARLAAPKLGVSPASRPLLGAAFAFIEARYMRPISLRDVARAVGRSPAHLTDLVRRETGRPVLAWIVERRMAEARRRLLETDEDVADIAEAVSYTDAAYFIRLFRRAHGMTPRAWRNAQRTPGAGPSKPRR